MPASDPAHCCLGTELIDRRTGLLWRLQPNGWVSVGRDKAYPAPDMTPLPAAQGTLVTSEALLLVKWYHDLRESRDRAASDYWDDGRLFDRVDSVRWAVADEVGTIPLGGRVGTVPRVLAAVQAAVAAFDAAVASLWHDDTATEWRRRVMDLSWEVALHTSVPLPLLIRIAANDIHGGCNVTFDGDCFEPPAWRAYVTGWPFVTFAGGGDTAEEAIRRALWKKDAYLIEARAKAKNNPEPLLMDGVDLLSFKEEDKP